MKNSLFSSLVYRIIGKPEAWHDEYIDIMHQIMDETDSIEDPKNFSELAFGDQILSRIQSSNEAILAFNSLLDKSRFFIIILDEQFTPIYHNNDASALLDEIRCPQYPNNLNPTLLSEIQRVANTLQDDTLQVLDTEIKDGKTLYFRAIKSNLPENNKESTFYLLLANNPQRDTGELSSDFIEKYNITHKEHSVLLCLIKGKSIKNIASDNFISENTVKTHIKSLYRKTGVHSQIGIISLALTHEAQVLDAYFGQPHQQKEENILDKFAILSNNNTICYRDYGPPAGRPLIVFHNGFGCRVSIPANYQEICEKTNRRVIIPDRPGYGKSPLHEQGVTDWFCQLDELLEQLEIHEFDVLGNVLASPLALHYVHQDVAKYSRIGKLILTCPAVINNKQDVQHLLGIFSPAARLVNTSKMFAQEIYELWLRSISLELDKHYKKMLIKSFGEKDSNFYSESGNVSIMLDGFREGSSLCIKGISREMVHNLTPLNLDLSQINIPVDLWLGSDDKRISLAGVQAFAHSIPNHTLYYKEGYSEHIYYAFFEDIIAY